MGVRMGLVLGVGLVVGGGGVAVGVGVEEGMGLGKGVGVDVGAGVWVRVGAEAIVEVGAGVGGAVHAASVSSKTATDVATDRRRARIILSGSRRCCQCLKEPAHLGVAFDHRLGVPLHADAEGMIGLFQALDDAVRGAGRDDQTCAHRLDRLVVGAVHAQFAIPE